MTASKGSGPTSDFDPLEKGFVADPHPTYARLRRECPVAYSSRWDFWTVTRYDDVLHVTANPEVFTSAEGITIPPNRVSGRRAPMHYDPPDHTDFRRAMNRPLRDERVLAFETPLRAVARRLLESLLAEPAADFGLGYTSPLATAGLGLLLGLRDEDVDFIEEHSRGFEDGQFAFDADRAESENLLLYDYARELVARRRCALLDPDDDLVSSLIDLVDRRPDLGDEFVAGSVRQLFIAAHVAPRVAVTSVLAHVAGDPAVQVLARDGPGEIPRVLDELLRLHAPNQGFSRTATRDVELSGRTIRRGQQVALAYPSANRDEDVFPDPDVAAWDRARTRHLTFGAGPHRCPGSTLARLETVVALTELLDATSWVELREPPERVHWPLTGAVTLRLIVAA